jgi:hypothetical protein
VNDSSSILAIVITIINSGEKIAVDQRVILKDNKQNRIAEVLLKNGELQWVLAQILELRG